MKRIEWIRWAGLFLILVVGLIVAHQTESAVQASAHSYAITWSNVGNSISTGHGGGYQVVGAINQKNTVAAKGDGYTLIDDFRISVDGTSPNVVGNQIFLPLVHR